MRIRLLLPILLFATACDDGESSAVAVDLAAPDQGPADQGSADQGGADQGAADAAVIDMAAPDDGCGYAPEAIDEYEAPPIHTPRWAFTPWISKDISDRADTEAFVAGFRERDIPVGVVVLDSPWETHYNTFIPNPDRYPDFDTLVTGLRAEGVRTVLWITQMVNTTGLDFEEGGDVYQGPSPNYAEGAACGFFINDNDTYVWWKGRGSGLDFFNPVAATWWHAQYDHLLDLGVAGWKLDFGEQYIKRETMDTAAGEVSFQAYSEKYYEDFYAYGASRLGTDEFVTMVRPYDESYEHAGRFFARPEHAPVAWVGDNRRDWVGLIDALDHLFRSAQAGYVMIGSDVGGYLDFEDVGLAPGPPVAFSRETFLRWVAQGAMTPFFQLHGRANLTPWTVEPADETVAIYRYWAWLHTALVPFWYSLAEQAYAGEAGPIMRPLGEGPEAWAGDWRYLLGDAFLVAPLIADGGIRDVALPAGTDWYDWWDLGAEPHPGGTTLEGYDSRDLLRIPLFLRGGAVVPLDVENDVFGLGTVASTGHLTVLAVPGAEPSQFTLVDDDEAATAISLAPEGAGHRLALSRALKPVIVALRVPWAAFEVGAPGAELADRAAFDAAEAGWFFEPERKLLWVKLPAAGDEVAVSVTPG